MGKYYNKYIPTIYRYIKPAEVGQHMVTTDLKGIFKYKSDDFWLVFNDGTEVAINGSFEDIQDDITNINNSIISINNSITTINNSITTINNTIGNIEDDIDDIEQQIAGGAGAFKYDETANAIFAADSDYVDSISVGEYSVDLQLYRDASYQSVTGEYSSAVGSSNQVSGNNSIAVGFENMVSSNTSVALGANHINNATGSITMGSTCDTRGNYSIAAGMNAIAYSYAEVAVGSYPTNYTASSTTAIAPHDRAFVVGNGSSSTNSNAFIVYKDGTVLGGTDNELSGTTDDSAAFGSGNQLKAQFSYAFGEQNSSGGMHGIAIGASNGITAAYGVAIGFNNSVPASFAMAFGYRNTSGSLYETSMGRYATVETSSSTTTWVDTDPLFKLGNGSGTTARNNALIIYKSGDAEFDGAIYANAGSIQGPSNNDLTLHSQQSDGASLTLGASGLVTATSAFRCMPTSTTPSELEGVMYVNSTDSTPYMYLDGSWVDLTGGGTDDGAFSIYDTGNIQAVYVTGRTLSTALGDGAMDLLSPNATSQGATGNYSLAFGYYSQASGRYSTAGGYSGHATGYYSFCTGQSCTSSGQGSVALGLQCTASGYGSFASGSKCTAAGDYSFAMGVQANAGSFGQITLGPYPANYTPVSATTWDEDDLLIMIGNGSSASDLQSAFYMYKSGLATFVGDLRAANLVAMAGTIQLAPLSSNPSSPTEGMMYLNDTDNTIRAYIGGHWYSVTLS